MFLGLFYLLYTLHLFQSHNHIHLDKVQILISDLKVHMALIIFLSSSLDITRFNEVFVLHSTKTYLLLPAIFRLNSQNRRINLNLPECNCENLWHRIVSSNLDRYILSWLSISQTFCHTSENQENQWFQQRNISLTRTFRARQTLLCYSSLILYFSL